MQTKCLTCGADMEVYKYSCSVEFFGGGFCRGATMKKETSDYCGQCSKCGTEYRITGEQTSYIMDSRREGE